MNFACSRNWDISEVVTGKIEAGLLILAMIAGPALLLGLMALDEDGSSFPSVSTREPLANLVLITMDGVASSDTSLDSNKLEDHPSLGRLANRGIMVKFSFAASDATPASLASLITGQLPSTHGVLGYDYGLSSDALTLAEILKLRQYRCAAISNDPALTGCNLAQGFDFVFDEVEANTETLASATGNWLKQTGGENFFLWVHMLPTLPKLENDNVPVGKQFDLLVGKVVGALKETQTFTSSFIVATASRSRTKTNLGVPMIVRTPTDRPFDMVVNGPCSSLDIVPSMLEALHTGVRLDSPGRSLVSPPHAPLYSGNFSEGNAPFEWLVQHKGGMKPLLGVSGAKKVLVESDEPGGYEIYSRQLDPWGQNNLIGDRSSRVFLEAYRPLLESVKKKIPKALPRERSTISPHDIPVEHSAEENPR